ncbi:hypothetical protein M3181_03210 [Mesobacillus maritimus]|uniref:hypothetical protein n=1 Tax=Mesobacillus maritimus TaxID=1643336 RepID=UPI00203BE773|nr:hypothetical protein [Mesobacillus maritimus]MCM3668010.1 hypothetical protein [Mesobacillus maritimus]
MEELKNVKVIDKGERPRFFDWGVYDYSSHLTAFNVYEQTWAALQAEGLTHLFNDDVSEFERKKLERKGANNDGI